MPAAREPAPVAEVAVFVTRRRGGGAPAPPGPPTVATGTSSRAGSSPVSRLARPARELWEETGLAASSARASKWSSMPSHNPPWASRSPVTAWARRTTGSPSSTTSTTRIDGVAHARQPLRSSGRRRHGHSARSSPKSPNRWAELGSRRGRRRRPAHRLRRTAPRPRHGAIARRRDGRARRAGRPPPRRAGTRLRPLSRSRRARGRRRGRADRAAGRPVLPAQ